MRRLKATLCYDGTDFSGWQIQPDRPTIQGWLQRVLTEIEGAPVPVTGSGRTDAGVHALAQVAAFTLSNPIPVLNLRKAMNRLLPPDIRVLEIEEVDESFHPIRDAKAKTYEYRIFRGEICSPFERRYVCHYPYPLDVARMAAAAPLFEGSHDFTCFAAADKSDDPARSKVRMIFSSRLEQPALDRLVYRVRGEGFLKHMVRNIVGLLIEVGKGNAGEETVRRYLTGRVEGKAGPTAPPQGLFLVRVEY